MDVLPRFEYLEELNLSNNQLQGLPDDMSQLKSVANLNLQNVAFNDFEQSVQSIATLPQLRSLYINLQTEDQVDLIMRYLPNLEYLNGLPVDREALDEDTQNDGDTHDRINAVDDEALKNGQSRVQELPDEEDSETQHEMNNQ